MKWVALIMLSIGALKGGQGNYYLALAHDDYYLKGGEPPGRWFGEGARAIGLTGKVDERAFKNILKGYSPDGRDPLIQNAGDEKHQAGWDLTFSCPKSVSALWSQADADVRKAIQDAQAEAVQAAIRYLQDAASFTRRGKGGHTREKAGLIVATFEHGTSRAQDPQLHTHCIALNVGVRADGTTGTILSQPLYVHKMAAGALFRAELANQLHMRLGIVVERPFNASTGRVESWFELIGVPNRLVQEFSKRREQVEMALAEQGASGARASAQLTLETRDAKAQQPRSELFVAWKEVGKAHGFTSEQVNRLLMKQGPRHDLVERVNTCIRDAVERITSQQSHFAEREVLRFAAEAAQGTGVNAEVVRHAVKQALSRSASIVCLGRVKGEIRYTTKEMLELERKMLAHVEELKNLPSRPVGEKTVRAVEEGMSDEQKQALRHVTQSGGSIQIVSGMAGTGKTSMLRATRDALEKEGWEVVGACISGKAAQGLEEGAGIKSSTVAKLTGIPEVGFRGDLEKGLSDTLKHHARQLARAAVGKSTWQEERIQLSPKTVLVIDEAGMVGTRQMERLTEKVLKAGARLVLVGDEKQLQAIEAGGPFASIGSRIGRASLTEIQRQREAWAREAVRKFASGQATEALSAYARRGLVTVAEDRKDAIQALIKEWRRDGGARPGDHLILASTNADVTVLNRMAQVERVLGGGLGSRSLRVGSCDLRRGDRVLFTKNSKLYGVENGSLGTVLGVDTVHRTLMVKLDKGKHVLIPVRDYAHVRLGYAVTTHKAQGLTTENSYVLLGGPTQDRELSYVQASRARGTTRFFIDKLEAGDRLRDLCRQMVRSRQKDLALDILEQQRREHVR